MQSLAIRHEDRARRKALNKAEGVALNGGPALSVGSVALAYRQFALLRSRLGNDEALNKELTAAIEGIDAEFAGGYRSLAEAPDGSGDTMAGIGVVNTNVVPAGVIATDEDAGANGATFKKDAAWSDTAPVTTAPLPEANFDPAKGNVNGQALAEQSGGAGGWGTETPTTRTDGDESGNGGGTGGNA